MNIRDFYENLDLQDAIAGMVSKIIKETKDQLGQNQPSVIVIQTSPEVLDAIETWAPANGYEVLVRDTVSMQLAY